MDRAHHRHRLYLRGRLDAVIFEAVMSRLLRGTKVARANVRLWHKADMSHVGSDVRFRW
jgi:hypothetical protein